jgi:hypothetical protein
MKPDLSVSSRELGFSCRSNALGLRGPADERAANVIFGTSYAMGIGVDNGLNWYEIGLPESGWLNLGLAVGIPEWRALLQCHHKGVCDTALVLYHPNLWAIALQFERWRQSGQDIFSSQNWKTGLKDCLILKTRRTWRRFLALGNGDWLRLRSAGQLYDIDCRYARFAAEQNRRTVERSLTALQAMLAPFRRVVVARLPIKQEFVPVQHHSPALAETLANYRAMWETFKGRLTVPGALQFHEPAVFKLEHYLPGDSHWNAEGNRAFAEWLGCLTI